MMALFALVLGFVMPEEEYQVFVDRLFEEEVDERQRFWTGYYGLDFYDTAYDRVGDVDEVKSSSAIVAHHLVVADEIARVFEQIGGRYDETVVLMSPNHFSVGVGPIVTTPGIWETVYGDVESDDEMVEKLIDAGIGVEEDAVPFETEHGIYGLMPFVKRSMPNAKVVPLMLDESLTREEATAVGVAISRGLPGATVVASVDMSHNLPEHVRVFHDDMTSAVIAAGYEQDGFDVEIDAVRVFDALFAFNSFERTEEWHETYRGSSMEHGLAPDWRENTSHVLGYFTSGKGSDDAPFGMHVVGDIMLDRGVRKQIDAAGDVGYPWDEVGRFLRGVHVRVGNLEGTVNEQESTYTYDPPFRFVFDPAYIEEMSAFIDVVSLANNHTSDVGSIGEEETQLWLDDIGVNWFGGYTESVPAHYEEVNGHAVAFVGYHAFQPDEDLLVATIEEADAAGAYVIVMPHWGIEYDFLPSAGQRRIAEVMIGAGADLIIGGHPHVPQGIERIDGVTVVYSLGNFVFDQEIPETWEAMTVGLMFAGDYKGLYLMPVGTRYGQPVPLGDEEARDLFDRLSEYSSSDVADMVRDGLIYL